MHAKLYGCDREREKVFVAGTSASAQVCLVVGEREHKTHWGKQAHNELIIPLQQQACMYNALHRAAGHTVQHKPQTYIQKQIH